MPGLTHAPLQRTLGLVEGVMHLIQKKNPLPSNTTTPFSRYLCRLAVMVF